MGVGGLWQVVSAEQLRIRDRRLVSACVLAVLLLVAAALRSLRALGTGPVPDIEAHHVTEVFSIDHFGQFVGGSGPDSAQLAWLQMACYTWVSGAFGREPTALAAVREAMFAVSMATACLVWLLARRLGASRWGAAAAVGVLAVSPLALGMQGLVLPENLAIAWALAAMVLYAAPPYRQRPPADLVATACLVVAVLTAPITVLLLPCAAGLVLRRGERRNWTLLLGGLLLVGVTIGLSPSALLARVLFTGNAPVAHLLDLDPVLAATAVVAAAAALLVGMLRPVAVGFLATLLAAVWPDGPAISALALLVPLGALLVPAVVETGIRRRARAPSGTSASRHAAVRPLAKPAIVVAVVLTVLAVPGWVRGLDALAAPGDDGGAVATAARWLHDNLRGARVLADDASWTTLVAAGLPPSAVLLPSDCDSGCPADLWVADTPRLRELSGASGRLADLLTASAPVAVFGAGPDQVAIRPAGSVGSTGISAGEAKARAAAGAALAGSTRISAGAEVADLLRTGRVDPRVLATLAALAATKPVVLTETPAIAGEDAAGQPRRQVLLAASGEPAEQIVLFFASQRGVFHPSSVTATPDGVLVSYPPIAPSGLLAPFETP